MLRDICKSCVLVILLINIFIVTQFITIVRPIHLMVWNSYKMQTFKWFVADYSTLLTMLNIVLFIVAIFFSDEKALNLVSQQRTAVSSPQVFQVSGKIFNTMKKYIRE